MESQLYAPDYIVIAGFFASMIVIGFYFAGRMKDTKDYFSGGKNIPWWISGISFYMSSFSAFAFIAYSSLVYRYGWMADDLLGHGAGDAGERLFFCRPLAAGGEHESPGVHRGKIQ